MTRGRPEGVRAPGLRVHEMPFGATCRPDGSTSFRLWAPSVPEVTLCLSARPTAPAEQRLRMNPSSEGWHVLDVPGVGAGARYRFALGGDPPLQVPDPASRCNPDDVHGASEVIDPRAHRWRDLAWRGRPWSDAVIYELHLGCFTPEGTFAAAAQRLPALAALGITAVELMPVAEFAGRRGWGYDGVLPYAPESSYGRPDDLKVFVEQAHALGLMVLLDVVYNHFGPEGNYLRAYCPEFFDASRQTPWGDAICFDGPQSETVRAFFVHNALYWLEEFHLDGLRLDAVHAMHDSSPVHIACEIAEAVRAGPGAQRQVHVVFEHDGNRASWLERDAHGVPREATAQWNDDLHHAAHVLLTGETDGYYVDYAERTACRLARALAQGFVYQGQPSLFRGGVDHGEPSGHLPPQAFVSFLQNHDQIGNRAFGERLSALAEPRRLEAAYACLLLSPQVPMLFMGEEYAASTPFLYFCDFEPGLARAVAEGRQREWARFETFGDPAGPTPLPDPGAADTAARSTLRWSEREQGVHAGRLALVQRLLALRRRWLWPRITAGETGGHYRVDGPLIHVIWPLADGAQWRMVAHVGGGEPVREVYPTTGLCVYQCHVDADGCWWPGAVRVELEPAPGDESVAGADAGATPPVARGGRHG